MADIVMNDFSTQFRGLNLREMPEEREGLLQGESNDELLDPAEQYENTVVSCEFGKFQILLLFVCGWAVASDSVEIQVVSFVLPSACDLSLSSVEKGWLNAVIFIGMLIGGYMFGGAADIKGRRFILIWSMTINGLFGLASSFAPTFAVFLILRFLSGVGVGAAMPILFSYFIEFLSKTRRGPMIGFLASFWMVGNIITSGIAWLIIPRVDMGVSVKNIYYGSWRIFVAVCSLPALTSALFVFLMPESPKYLQKVGRYEDAANVFSKMFFMNKGEKHPLPREIKEFKESNEKRDRYRERSDEEEIFIDQNDMCLFCKTFTGIFNTIFKVFKQTKKLFEKPLRTTTFILLFVWLSLSFGYYGLWMWFPEIFERIENGGSSCGGPAAAVNSTGMVYNKNCMEKVKNDTGVYYEAFLVAISNLPGNLATILLINKLGRRLLLALSMGLAGISVFFFWMVKTELQMLIMSCVFSGLSIAGWNSLDAVAVENYPTNLRSLAFGVQAAVGRVAAVLGNVVFGQLVDVHCSIPLLMVASLLVAGGLSVLKLPRTDENSLD